MLHLNPFVLGPRCKFKILFSTFYFLPSCPDANIIHFSRLRISLSCLDRPVPTYFLILGFPAFLYVRMQHFSASFLIPGFPVFLSKFNLFLNIYIFHDFLPSCLDATFSYIFSNFRISTAFLPGCNLFLRFILFQDFLPSCPDATFSYIIPSPTQCDLYYQCEFGTPSRK